MRQESGVGIGEVGFDEIERSVGAGGAGQKYGGELNDREWPRLGAPCFRLMAASDLLSDVPGVT